MLPRKTEAEKTGQGNERGTGRGKKKDAVTHAAWSQQAVNMMRASCYLFLRAAHLDHSRMDKAALR